MRGTRNRWAVALRIARRGALRSWGRSLLIVALIAVPITALAGAAVLLPSLQATTQERIQGTLGSAQALLTPVGNPADRIRQGAEGGWDYSAENPDGTGTVTVDPRTVLPGVRVLPVRSAAAVFRTASGEASLPVETGRTWDPSLNGGPFVLLSGRRPTATDEVLVSPAALQRLGAHVGGTIRMLAPSARTLTVVGTSRDRALPSVAETVFAGEALLPASGIAERFYVPDASIDWAQVQRLNRVGTTVFSRQVVLHPPAGVSDVAGANIPFGTVAVVALALLFALLEVALLAGAAFLVGARLQQRLLATVASVGADRAVLRRVITANGVVLGTVGGLVGTALGIAGAIVLMRLTDDGTWTRYPGLHLWWPLLAGIVAFGVLVGWSAALVPARAAARFDVVRALRGARTPQRVGRKPVLGIVLLAVGAGLALLGAVLLPAALQASGEGATAVQLGVLALLGGGPVLAQLGALLCTGLLLRGVARLFVHAPLPVRLAARDTSRNLGRAVPAVAAVMTTVFVAAFAMCMANTASITAAAGHYWQRPVAGEAFVSVLTAGDAPATAADARASERAVREHLPVRSIAVVATSRLGSDSTHPSDRTRDAMAVVRFPGYAADCGARARRDPADLRCGPFTAQNGQGEQAQQQLTIGDAAALAANLGRAPSAAALDALQHGGAVALRSDLAPGGVGRLDWYTPKQLAGDWTSGTPRRTTRLTTVVDLPVHPGDASLFVSPATATALHVPIGGYQLDVAFTRPPTDVELDAANAALGALVNQPQAVAVTVEQGPQAFGGQIAWLILLACLVVAVAAGATAIGLARVDGRADDVTLASLGASPRIRRTVALVQALVVCGVGAVVGTVLGLLPAFALGVGTESFPFHPPVLQLLLTAAGIPVVIGAGAWLLVGTRRADLSRRTAIA